MHAHDDLCISFSQGDMDALSMLVETYKNDLYNLCFRLSSFNTQDADDLFQQTWIKAVKNATKYNHKAFRSWLFKICMNQFRDNNRRLVKRQAIIKDDFESTHTKDYLLSSVSKDESVEEQVEKKHIQAVLVANIDKLPKNQKIPVMLFYYQQLKYTEIAYILHIPEGTVKSRINAAKRKLRDVLESEIYV